MVSFAATINVTDPVSGDFLGRSNTVSFNISNATVRAEVVVTATFNDNPTIQVTQRREVTPNVSGQASGSINLNFSESQQNGAYTISVTVISSDSYNNVPEIDVTVDVKDPKILSFNPIQNTFVRDLVAISALFEEENIDEWRVTVGGNDIPGNIGSTNTLNVDWDSDTVTSDGNQNISIRIEDLAGNTATQSIPVTIDRLKPSTSILSPIATQTYRPDARIPVVVEISDQFSDSLDERNIDVTIETTNGDFVARVALISTNSSGNNLVWTGRLRDSSSVPSTFVIRVVARDKAGNVANDQTVTIVTTRGARNVRSNSANGRQPSRAVRDAAALAAARGGIDRATRKLYTRGQRDIFGRGYNQGGRN